MKHFSALLALSFALSCALPPDAYAPSHAGHWDVGGRAGTTLGDGVPSNDMFTYAAFGRYHVNDRWAVGLELDLMTYDFEEPAPRVLGINTSEPLDPAASSTLILAFAEYNFLPAQSRHEFVALGGIGVASPDVDDLNGVDDTGAPLTVVTDPGSETILSLGLGYRFQLSRHWHFELLGRYNHHLADWEVMDTSSGATGSVDDYGTNSVLLGLTYRF